jgi:hypothetical protein
MTMNKFNITAIAVAIGLAFSAGAMAQSMSKDEYKVHKDSIVAQYDSAKAGCDSFAGNAKDICMAEAKGKEKVAKAELEARNKPTQTTRYQARVARAEADFAVATEKCDDQAGNMKDVCVKEAKAAETAAKANAKAQMKTADANEIADEKSSDARAKANKKSADAREDAAADKRDADYAVAKEKCDAFASDAKNQCIASAKARYGKS